jgi:hypothetical protein
MFVTSQGSPYARFRRALGTRNPNLALAAAAELERISLADALAVCMVLATAGDRRFSRAAGRWLERYAAERQPTLEELLHAAAALSRLRAEPGCEVARATLASALRD